MPDLHLFDEQHRSSLPLNLAYKAAQLADIDKADEFLKICVTQRSLMFCRQRILMCY